MKELIGAIILAQLCIALGKEGCPTLLTPIEDVCEYASVIKVTTSDKTTVDKKNCNNNFDKNKLKDQPMVHYPSANPSKTYTIVLIDPDEDQTYRWGEYYLHWIISNIPGKDLATGDLSKGKDLIPYEEINPKNGENVHRIIVFLFEEEQVNQKIEETPTDRKKFYLIHWLAKQPKHLCGPVAGISFKVSK